MKHRKIEATEGMIYTNGEAFGKTIYLGNNDSIENWYEITEEEYEKIISDNGGEDTNENN